MKTNQVLTRRMGDFSVYQRTSDGMFNGTLLLKQWNENSGMKKEVKHFLNENKGTQEFVDALISEENLKGRNSAYLQSRGKNGGTWMHPYLFIKFAMWLNPKFEVKVIKFVYDQLIQYRNEAGETYQKMCASIKSISGKDDIAKNISRIARAINIIVYGKHEREARNKQADENSMKELSSLQSNISELISLGYLTTFESVREYLLKKWSSKYQPSELTASQ